MKLIKTQYAQIEENLNSFKAVFGNGVLVERMYHSGGFYVHYPQSTAKVIKSFSSLDEVNGWLRGCVDAFAESDLRKGYLGIIERG